PLAGERLRPLGHVSADPYAFQATEKQGFFSKFFQKSPNPCFYWFSPIFTRLHRPDPCNPCKIRANRS
ncbi:hypothetical protein ACGYK5_17230, partial [Sulfitobacter sp. 1A16787]|uniref:hypothetical protein n=1 Tax=Sulfitobacter sp. 1A16787 TaxID=3368571 RepID=UPI00374670FE